MAKTDTQLSTQAVKDLAAAKGADLVGIADLKVLKDISTYPRDLLGKYKYAVSVGVALERYGGYDNATENKAFRRLERIAKQIEKHIQNEGFASKIIPCDKRVERKGPLHWLGGISHKAVARAGGLGWIGKSTLLVTPEFGPRVCLITILTTMSFVADQPAKNRCGNCRECVKSCPLNAVLEFDFTDYPGKVERVLDISKCGPYITKTWREGDICWNCLLACPYGKRKARPRNMGHDPDSRLI